MSFILLFNPFSQKVAMRRYNEQVLFPEDHIRHLLS